MKSLLVTMWVFVIASNGTENPVKNDQSPIPAHMERIPAHPHIAKNLGISVPTLYRWIPASAKA